MTAPGPTPVVCGTCHTRVTQVHPSGLWIHARTPRPWHPAQPTRTQS